MILAEADGRVSSYHVFPDGHLFYWQFSSSPLACAVAFRNPISVQCCHIWKNRGGGGKGYEKGMLESLKKATKIFNKNQLSWKCGELEEFSLEENLRQWICITL